MAQRPPQGEILIGVLGVTGSGKTTFIQKATGRKDLVIGHGLESCTQELCLTQFMLDGKTVTLIDTPGFDDTHKTDSDILRMIAKFLAESYDLGVLLTGIILCQAIDENRARGSEVDRTRLFEEVCGENAFGNIILNTTMWSNVPKSTGDTRVRERVTKAGFWGKMCTRGALVTVCDNTPEGARKIVRMLLNKPRVELQMQVELAQNGGYVPATSAGRQLSATLDGATEKLIEEIRELRVNHALQQDYLRFQIQELQETLRQLRNQQNVLSTSQVSLPGSGNSASWVAALATLAGVGVSGAAAISSYANGPATSRFVGPGVVCYVANRSSTDRQVQYTVSEAKVPGAKNWAAVTTVEITRRR